LNEFTIDIAAFTIISERFLLCKRAVTVLSNDSLT